jgi:phosphoserine phosphatase
VPKGRTLREKDSGTEAQGPFLKVMVNNALYKLALFDLDGTLTREKSIWQYIHIRLGKWHGFAETYQERFLKGEISYEAFCELDARVWKGMRVEALMDIVRTVPFHPGADALIHHLKKKGLRLAMISAGLSLLSDWVHQKYGFDYSVSNDLVHENNFLTGKVRVKVYNDRKGEWVREILKKFGVKREETLAIGDSSGDLEMFRSVGFSVAFNSSCADLDRVATVCIKNQDLTDIIPCLPL